MATPAIADNGFFFDLYSLPFISAPFNPTSTETCARLQDQHTKRQEGIRQAMDSCDEREGTFSLRCETKYSEIFDRASREQSEHLAACFSSVAAHEAQIQAQQQLRAEERLQEEIRAMQTAQAAAEREQERSSAESDRGEVETPDMVAATVEAENERPAVFPQEPQIAAVPTATYVIQGQLPAQPLRPHVNPFADPVNGQEGLALNPFAGGGRDGVAAGSASGPDQSPAVMALNPFADVPPLCQRSCPPFFFSSTFEAGGIGR